MDTITKTMKAVLFARVSTREQADEGYSLPAQEKLLKEYSEKCSFTKAKSFSVPESASGKHERRIFNEMLEYLNAHPEVKILVCEKVDRLTRNLKDAVDINKWLNEDDERQVHFVKENVAICNDSKSNEKFIWNIKVSVAQYYTDNLSEETKKGLYEKADQGHFPGNHKRGYKTIGDIGHKIWAIDDDTPDARYITKAFQLYDTGNHTLRTLSKILYEDGWKASNGKPISISEMHKLLIDPFYCGEFVWKGILYRKNIKHPALITKELFYSVQDRLQRKVKAGKYRKHTFQFGGSLLVCDGCGRAITWETHKGHIYGHCTGYKTECPLKSKWIRQEKVEEKILETLDQFKVENPRLLEWIRKALKESHKDEIDYHETIVTDLDAQYLRIKNRLDKLYDDKVDGLLSKERYLQKQEEYEQQINDILEAKEKHSKANINYQKLGINIFELAQVGREVYQNQESMEKKKELLNFVFSNFKLNQEKLVPTPHNGFEVVFARAKDSNWLRDMDSNHDR